MELCKPRLISKINSYFVPLVLEMDHGPRIKAASHTPQGTAMLRAIESDFSHGTALLRTFVFDGDGKMLSFAFPMVVPRAVGRQVNEAIDQLCLRKGEALTSFHDSPRRADTTLALQVVLRYTDPDLVERLRRQLHRYCGLFQLDVEALRSATRDLIQLSAAECQQLLPPQRWLPARTYRVPDAMARSLLVHFRPEPAMMTARTDDEAVKRVRRVRLVGTDYGGGRVRFEGELELLHPGLRPEWDPPAPTDGNTVRLAVTGWMEWNPVTRQISSLSLATREAAYCSPEGGVAHFAGIASSTIR